MAMTSINKMGYSSNKMGYSSATAVWTLVVLVLISACGTAAVGPVSQTSSSPTSATSARTQPTSSPSTSAPATITISFVLVIKGTVPASDSFVLKFEYPNAGQTGFEFCNSAMPSHPCNVTAGELRLVFQQLGALNYSAHYAYGRDVNGKLVQTFADGSVSLNKSNTVSATYAYAG